MCAACILPDVQAGEPHGAAGSRALRGCETYVCDEQIVRDPRSGLSWQRVLPEVYDGCAGGYLQRADAPGSGCTWEEAKRYCSQLGVASGGWRLPTKDELLTIADMTRSGPSIDVEAFPGTPSEYFWSSSPYEGQSGNAWDVYFLSGYSYFSSVTAAYRVRCVR